MVIVCSSSCAGIKRNIPFCGLPNETEIIDVGERQLAKFCSQKGIDRQAFINPPEISFDEKERIWVIDYESSEHFVRFIVDNCGWIETSFGPASKVTKVE